MKLKSNPLGFLPGIASIVNSPPDVQGPSFYKSQMTFAPPDGRASGTPVDKFNNDMTRSAADVGSTAVTNRTPQLGRDRIKGNAAPMSKRVAGLPPIAASLMVQGASGFADFRTGCMS